MIRRRLVPVAAALLTLALPAAAEPPSYPPVPPDPVLEFPRDHGAHPEFRTEWWYLTGWLDQADGRHLGFQITFFRTRPAIDEADPSRFAPRQILFAHAALSDPAIGHLLHDQRIARAGFGLADAKIGDLDVTLDDWRLARLPDGSITAFVKAADFTLDFKLALTEPMLPEGVAGYSRKGPDPKDASVYFSAPHLALSGAVTRQAVRAAVTGEAWLDREWSSTLLDPAAVGWDWLGIDLADGGALMAFQIRDQSGARLWAGGTLRAADGGVQTLGPADVSFGERRRWTSPHTGTAYPVEPDLTLKLPGGDRHWSIEPLFDDQELDSRPLGPIYWEGAVRADGDGGAGRGYLELTGYAERLRM